MIKILFLIIKFPFKIFFINSKKRNKQIVLDRKFIKIAREFSTLSKCVSHQVACLIVKNNRIISSGINGTSHGCKNCDEIFNKKKFDRKKHHQFSDNYEIHAEQNAVAHAAKNGIALNESVAYCTLEPCIHCCKLLSVTGIDKIVYGNKYDMYTNDYRKQRSIILKKLNIKLEMIK